MAYSCEKEKTRSSAIAEKLRNALVSTNTATTKHPIWKWLQSTNDLEVCTPKVIIIAAFTLAIHHVLLVAGCYSVFIKLRSWDTTTFEVNVTDDDLDKWLCYGRRTAQGTWQ